MAHALIAIREPMRPMRRGEMTSVSHKGNMGRERASLKPCPRKNYVCLRRTVLRQFHVGDPFPSAAGRPHGFTHSAEEGALTSGSTPSRKNRGASLGRSSKAISYGENVRRTPNFFHRPLRLSTGRRHDQGMIVSAGLGVAEDRAGPASQRLAPLVWHSCRPPCLVTGSDGIRCVDSASVHRTCCSKQWDFRLHAPQRLSEVAQCHAR